MQLVPKSWSPKAGLQKKQDNTEPLKKSIQKVLDTRQKANFNRSVQIVLED